VGTTDDRTFFLLWIRVIRLPYLATYEPSNPMCMRRARGADVKSVDEVSPTEPVDGMLITVDDDVDIDQAKREIAETVNKLTSTYELQENPDAGCSDTLSSESGPQRIGLFLILTGFQIVAPSELSYLTARTSCETDQPDPCSIDPPASLSNHDIRSGVPPAGHWPPTTPSLPFTIHSFSPMNPPPTNSFPMSPPPTGPSPTDPPSAPTATSSLRADSPPPVFNFQNNTFVCTNLLLHALNDLRLNSGNGSNFSDHNSGCELSHCSTHFHTLMLSTSFKHGDVPSGICTPSN